MKQDTFDIMNIQPTKFRRSVWCRARGQPGRHTAAPIPAAASRSHWPFRVRSDAVARAGVASVDPAAGAAEGCVKAFFHPRALRPLGRIR